MARNVEFNIENIFYGGCHRHFINFFNSDILTLNALAVDRERSSTITKAYTKNRLESNN